MSVTTTGFWVKYNDELRSWCCGIGPEAVFMGFSSEEAAWTWLRQHLADKYEAVLRGEERRDAALAEQARRRSNELAFMLYQMPTPGKEGLH